MHVYVGVGMSLQMNIVYICIYFKETVYNVYI